MSHLILIKVSAGEHGEGQPAGERHRPRVPRASETDEETSRSLYPSWWFVYQPAKPN